MADQKQPLVIGLGRGFNGFYCPETRFHLIGVIKPSAVYTAAKLSEDVKRGLRGGSLIDVNKLLTLDDLKPGDTFVANITSVDRKRANIELGEQIALDEHKSDVAAGTEKDNYVLPDFSKESGEFLSEPDILTGTKKELLAYIAKTDGLDLAELGLTTRSDAEDVKRALISHFGYDKKPAKIDESKKAEQE